MPRSLQNLLSFYAISIGVHFQFTKKLLYCHLHRGLVASAVALQSVDLDSIPSSSYSKKSKMVFIVSLLGTQHAMDNVEKSSQFSCCVLGDKHLTGYFRLYVADRWRAKLSNSPNGLVLTKRLVNRA